MFEGALGKGPASRGRVWLGAVISVGAHGALLWGALLISSGPAPTPSEAADWKGPVQISLDHFQKGTQHAAQRAAAAPVKKRKPRPEVKAPLAVTRPAEVDPAPELPDPEDPVTGGDQPVTGGEITAEGPRGLPGGSCEGPDCLQDLPPGATLGTETRNYDSRMTAPLLLSGDAPEYTREAREARVQGTMIVKCVIALSGLLENCRVIKPLPHMEEEVLSALATRRYKPVTLDGQPLPVNYVFHIRLEMPQ